MVFAEMFRQKMRREGRAAGREEANDAWREWNRRREVAIVEVKPFDEPTPDAKGETKSPRT